MASGIWAACGQPPLNVQMHFSFLPADMRKFNSHCEMARSSMAAAKPLLRDPEIPDKSGHRHVCHADTRVIQQQLYWATVKWRDHCQDKDIGGSLLSTYLETLLKITGVGRLKLHQARGCPKMRFWGSLLDLTQGLSGYCWSQYSLV